MNMSQAVISDEPFDPITVARDFLPFLTWFASISAPFSDKLKSEKRLNGAAVAEALME